MGGRPAPVKYRYNPRLGKPMGKVYRPWYLLFALITVLIGIGSVACSVAVIQFDKDIHMDLFHIWAGIPLIVVAILGIIVFATKVRKTIIVFLIVVIVVAVVCAAATCIGGLRYWLDGWQAVKKERETDGKCTDVNGNCVCSSLRTMPSTVDCDDLDHMVYLIIAQICLSGGGFVMCVAGSFLGFMSICCGPWQYMEDYDKHYDPDFSNNYPVQHRTFPQDINFEKSHANTGYANGNDHYNHQ